MNNFYSGLDDDELDILSIMEIANPELASSIKLLKKAVNAIDCFCEANGKERLPIDITAAKSRTMKGCYMPGSGSMTLYIDEKSNDQWADDYEMKPDDGSPYTVLLHEYGHCVHHEWLDCEDMPFGEAQLSNRDFVNNLMERFAETFRVFVDNPNNLKVQNPTRYKWMTERLKLPAKKYGEGKECEFKSSMNEESIELLKLLSVDEFNSCYNLCEKNGMKGDDILKTILALAETRKDDKYKK